MDEKTIQNIWKSGTTGSFLSPAKAFHILRKTYPKITLKAVQEAITKLDNYNRFSGFKRRTPIHGSHNRHIESGYKGSSFHCDTFYINGLPGKINCYLIVVDSFTRRLFVGGTVRSMNAVKALKILKQAIKIGGQKPATIYSGQFV